METEVRRRKNKAKSEETAVQSKQVDGNKAESKTLQSTSETLDGSNSKENHSKEAPTSENSRATTNLRTTEEYERSVSNYNFNVTVDFDLISIGLFVVALATRFVNLTHPNNVVFDELHYGKYIALYMKRTFFFDQHPPLGKQLIAAAAHLAGFDGNFTFSKIGAEYTENVPIFMMRAVPAFCGSLLVPIVYKLLLQLKLSQWTALVGGLLILFDNALVTQSRFILMEAMLLVFSLLGLLLLMKFHSMCDRLSVTNYPNAIDRFGDIIQMVFYAILSATFFTCAICVKYAAFYSCCLGIALGCRHLWLKLADRSVSDFSISLQIAFRFLLFTVVPAVVYVTIFWAHLEVLNKAGPHDSVMTSAFQASLEGGLASITKGQPLKVAHGSQVTLRHTHGRTCWLHSHAHVYPVRYHDKRGSSHQQQVTCYSFKDVHNWWIVKRPDKKNLVVGGDTDSGEPDVIHHGDEIQLVHGITSRALNSHDVAAPVTPQCQEVSCYIDYNVSMSAQIIWRVEILNRDQEGDDWHTIKSQVRLVHKNTGAALRFSGRQLPDWGFNQHEVVADRIVDQLDTIWNVEEHRYTKTADQRERERQLVQAEMIPTKPTTLTFWEKFFELQQKMLWYQPNTEVLGSHMYSSEPLEWPFLSKGIAYWVDRETNAQIHLLGNVLIWNSATMALAAYIGLLIFYLLRRRRLCFDIDEQTFQQFCRCGEVFLTGYAMHFVPYFFVERTLFLHNYLPALIFKILLLCALIEHIFKILNQSQRFRSVAKVFVFGVILWLLAVLHVFQIFSTLSYGLLAIDGQTIKSEDIIALRWRDTWDFILHRELA